MTILKALVLFISFHIFLVLILVLRNGNLGWGGVGGLPHEKLDGVVVLVVY